MNNFYLKYLKYKKKYLVLRNQLGGAYIATFKELNDQIIDIKNDPKLKINENTDDATKTTINEQIKLLNGIMVFNKNCNTSIANVKTEKLSDKKKIEQSIENLKVKIAEYNKVYEPKLSVPEFLNKNINEIISLIDENNSNNQKLSNHSQQRISDNIKQNKIEELKKEEDQKANELRDKELAKKGRQLAQSRGAKKFKEIKSEEASEKNKLENETNHKKESLERLEKERLERLE
jgi:hypothetical protein